MTRDPKRSTSHGYWRYSAEYFLAGEVLRKSPGRELLMPAFQLYGQSVELALKAFLLKRGLSLNEVERLRHNLTEILSISRRRLLGREVKLSRIEIELIKLLNTNYVNHRFRYMISGTIRVPELDQIASVNHRLVAGLEKYCTGMVWGLSRIRNSTRT